MLIPPSFRVGVSIADADVYARANVSRDQLRHDLRAILADGVSFSVMVGMGETYLAAFALAVGHSEVVAGLLASVPLLIGAALQLVTPYGVRWLGSHRRWVVLCARVQAASFLPLILGALAGYLPVVLLFAAAASYWGAGMGATAAWNTWVARIVPSSMRPSFFSRRSRIAQIVVFLSVVTAGAVLESGARTGRALSAFALLFVTAAVARLVSSHFLASQSEPPAVAVPPVVEAAVTPAAPADRQRAGLLLRYLVVTQLAVNVTSPYFTPYMLNHLSLGYASFVGLTATALIARVAALPVLGSFAERHGAHRLLVAGSVAIVPLPMLWIVSPSLVWLGSVQIAAGFAWAAFELATLLLFFDALDEDRRTVLLTRYNLANATAIVGGALAGATILHRLGASSTAYATLFTVSTVGRLLALGLLRRVPDLRPIHGAVATRPIAVRPSLGVLERPILAALSRRRAEVTGTNAGRGREAADQSLESRK